MVVCDFCGTTAPSASGVGDAHAEAADDVPFTWVTSVENGKRSVYCDRCAREHLRAIESKLDAEWW